jgi:hypothetical protein
LNRKNPEKLKQAATGQKVEKDHCVPDVAERLSSSDKYLYY